MWRSACPPRKGYVTPHPMDKDTLTILIIAGLTLFVWVPAIVLSVLRALRKEKETRQDKNQTK